MLESLGKYFSQNEEGPLRRLYLSQKIRSALREEFGIEATVVVAEKRFIIKTTAAEAAFKLGLKKAAIAGLIGRLSRRRVSAKMIKITARPV